MTVVIPDEFAEFVDEEVASGHYSSSNDVLTAALALLRQRSREMDWDALKSEIEFGIQALETGNVQDFDPQDTKARGRQRLAAKSSQL